MYIFCDIDETIISNNVIRDSTKEAINLLKENGHKVFIASGRAKAEIYPNILELGFDGFVLSNGCFILYEDKPIYIEHMSLQDVTDVCDFCDQNNIEYVVDTDSKLLGRYSFIETYAKCRFDNDIEKAKKVFAAFQVDEVRRNDVTKINVVADSDYKIEILREKVCPKLSFRHYAHTSTYHFVEIENHGNSKGKGIERLIKHLNCSMDETIAIGDEINDLEMIKMCHLGICMGNGNEIVKNEADIIADTIDNDGFYKVFKELKLI